MRYNEFERVMSKTRMQRYLFSVSGNTKKAMRLYRLNLTLSQELFTIISCFEIALRNSIDRLYISQHGSDWLRDSIMPGGIFTCQKCTTTANIIQKALSEIEPNYKHEKLLSKMDFGFWRYLFAQPLYNAGGRVLLKVFPNKPKSTPTMNIDNSAVFNKIGRINELRNRIAHHEPVCFRPHHNSISTAFSRNNYDLIKELYRWMAIDEASLLYGIDHVLKECDRIDSL